MITIKQTKKILKCHGFKMQIPQGMFMMAIRNKVTQAEDPKTIMLNVKVITHPESTTEDMLDYIKPISRTKSDILIIHTGSLINGVNTMIHIIIYTNGVNTMKKLRKLVKVVREIEESEEIKIGFSSVIFRKDKDLEDEQNKVNIKLKKYCEGKGFVFLENANIDESCLNNSKLP